MRMSLPNREKHIQVKCQIQLCSITELLHTAFRKEHNTGMLKKNQETSAQI